MLSNRHEIFLVVASKLSFSKASEILFISQPAISKHIKELEIFYNTQLFERVSNSIQLTKAGILLLEKIKEVKGIQNKLEFEISVLKNNKQAKGQLKLGASTTVALYIIPKYLSLFHQQYPDIKVNLLNRNTDSVIKALINKEIDIGIVEGNGNHSGILYKPFVSDEVVAVCSSKSHIAKMKNITIKKIVEFPIALRDHGSGTLSAVKYQLEKLGIKLSDLKVGVRLGGTEALKNFLKVDNCLGFLPKGSIVNEIKENELVIVKIEHFEIKRNFFFIQRQGTENLALNKLFIKICSASL
jgi:DNA-binding transcriptional LysR family regulator